MRSPEQWLYYFFSVPSTSISRFLEEAQKSESGNSSWVHSIRWDDDHTVYKVIVVFESFYPYRLSKLQEQSI